MLVAATLLSCEQEVKNGIIPEFKQKLVISSFISPADTVSYIDVSSNRRIYGELGIIESTGNLSVLISDDTKEIPLKQVSSRFLFRPADLVLEGGKTYQLKVTSDKGLTADASCALPINRRFEIIVDTIRQTLTYYGGYKQTTLSAKISITDFPGEDNYYRVYCEQEFYKRYNKLIHNKTRYSGFKNDFITDKGKDGEKIEFTVPWLTTVLSNDSSVFKVFLLNTNKAYYDYHISLKNYSGGDDPFTEVSPVYSNITGGLGVFAGYTIDSLIFQLH